MINTVLFDLDGTLLPMVQETFVKTYMGDLVTFFSARGLDGKKLMKSFWAGVEASVKNDGSRRNEEVFWDQVTGIMGEEILERMPEFEEFYREAFQKVKRVAEPNPLAKAGITLLKKKGYMVVAATSPLFPKIATESRIRWAGLVPEDFALITTYENSTFCKPNLDYYREILSKIGKTPEECLMVGNDVDEDMCTRELGMENFLLSDFIISRKGTDIRGFRQGGFEELYAYIEELPDLKMLSMKERAEQGGFTKAGVIAVADLEFDHAFRKYCAENVCGQYGKNLSCPPSCGTPEEMEAKARNYEQALVLQTIYKPEDLTNAAEMKKLKKEHNIRSRKFVEQLRTEGMAGILANAGPCSFCAECAGLEGESCRFPEELSSCLSAYCINAQKMAERCGMEYWCKDGQVAFFSIYFF